MLFDGMLVFLLFLEQQENILSLKFTGKKQVQMAKSHEHQQSGCSHVWLISARKWLRHKRPLWSRKEISIPITGIESEMKILWIAELLRCTVRFHFTFMAWAWGLKMCLSLLSIIQAKTAEQIYNSATWELIQFIGAGCLFFPNPNLPLYSFF